MSPVPYLLGRPPRLHPALDLRVRRVVLRREFRRDRRPPLGAVGGAVGREVAVDQEAPVAVVLRDERAVAAGDDAPLAGVGGTLGGADALHVSRTTRVSPRRPPAPPPAT